MEKIIKIDYRAEKELNDFSEDVYYKFEGLIKILRSEGKIGLPNGKKIGTNLFEIRIKINGEYRGIYAYVKLNSIVILCFFRKKTQKTPLKLLKLARKRLNEYE